MSSEIIIIIVTVGFLIICSFFYTKNEEINRLKFELDVLKESKDSLNKHQDYLMREMNEKEKECLELRDQVEKLLFILKPNKNGKSRFKGTPVKFEKGMVVTVYEDGYYQDYIYTGKRAKYYYMSGYAEEKDGDYVFYTLESKDIIRGVKEAELDEFRTKVKSYSF